MNIKQTAITGAILLLVGFIGYNIIVAQIVSLTAPPVYPTTASYASAAAQTTACEALGNTLYETNSVSPNTSKLDATNCPVSGRFPGVISILELVPLIMVVGFMAIGAHMLTGGRSTGFAMDKMKSMRRM